MAKLDTKLVTKREKKSETTPTIDEGTRVAMISYQEYESKVLSGKVLHSSPEGYTERKHIEVTLEAELGIRAAVLFRAECEKNQERLTLASAGEV